MTETNTSPPNNESFLPQSTVLIVDDNPQNVELLQAFLESLPVKIVTAGDGLDALAKAAEHHPDLILLDIMMPQMSGFQVCRKLKGDPKTRDIQILMVTALNELGDIEQANECGTDDFVSKPVNKLELLTRVKSLLRVRGALTDGPLRDARSAVVACARGPSRRGETAGRGRSGSPSARACP